MPNPLTVCDDAMLRALVGYSGVTNIVPATRIRRFDRTVDLQALEPAPTLPFSVWMFPRSSPIDPYYGGEKVQILLGYEIGCVKRTANVEDFRLLEYEIMRAFLYMGRWISWTGSAGSYSQAALTATFDPTPWVYDSVTIKSSDPRRQPVINSERWQSLIDVSINLVGEVASILA